MIEALGIDWESYSGIARDKLKPLGDDNKLDQWSQVRDDEAKPLMDRMSTTLSSLDAAETADAVVDSDAARSTYTSSGSLSLTILIVGLLVALAMGLVVARRIVGRYAGFRASDAFASDLTRTSGLTSRDEPGRWTVPWTSRLSACAVP